jgi:transposase-like protein
MVEHKPEDVKRQALLMYLENSGFNPIGRILRVSSDTMDLDLR